MDTATDPSDKPLKYIRESVFGMRQQEFAAALGCRRWTMSKYETGKLPIPYGLMKSIRALADDRKIAWDDRWFFEVPTEEVAA